MLTLIPKENNATEMKKFKHIALINCSFKILSKALNNRLITIIDRLISPNLIAFIKGKYILERAFIKGTYILESVVATHEIIHEVDRKKEAGIILKLDYKKAYNRVDWDLLEEGLKSRGSSGTWINWITKMTRGVSICARLNDENGSYFLVGKGLRQGDPLSHLLFNFVVDVFTKILSIGRADLRSSNIYV